MKIFRKISKVSGKLVNTRTVDGKKGKKRKIPEWAYFTLPGYVRAVVGDGANNFINVNSIIFGRIISHGEKDFC